jgi:hypothetical protein
MTLPYKLIRVFSFFMIFSFSWYQLLPVEEEVSVEQAKQLYTLVTQQKELIVQKYEYYNVMIAEMTKQIGNNIRNLQASVRLDILYAYILLSVINPEYAKIVQTPFIAVSILAFLVDKGYQLREVFQALLYRQQKKQMEIEQAEMKANIDQVNGLITQLEQQNSKNEDITKRSVDTLLHEYLTVQSNAQEMKD